MQKSFLALALCSFAATWLPHAQALPEDPGGLRVLLVGNSYTRFNVLPTLLRRVGASVSGGEPLAVEMVAKGGYTLRMHWQRREAITRIRRRDYTHVVLQDHSLRPIDQVAEMTESVQRFVHEIAEVGAHAILYETWARRAGATLYGRRSDLSGPLHMQAKIGEVYRQLAADYGVRLAPVGSAFLAAGYLDPEIALYRGDGAHPSLAGSYLAACVIYGAVSGVDPRRAVYLPWGLNEGHGARLRQLASTVLRHAAPRRPARSRDVWPFPVRSDAPWADVAAVEAPAPEASTAAARPASVPADTTPSAI